MEITTDNSFVFAMGVLKTAGDFAMYIGGKTFMINSGIHSEGSVYARSGSMLIATLAVATYPSGDKKLAINRSIIETFGGSLEAIPQGIFRFLCNRHGTSGMILID